MFEDIKKVRKVIKKHFKYWANGNGTIYKTGWYSNKNWYRYLTLRYFFKRKISIISIQHMLTTLCTLKCKECCCFIPYYKKEGQLLPLTFEKYKKQLDELLKYTDKILIYAYMGGECFLVKDLPKIIEYAAKQKQIRLIHLPTNATIIPSEELVDVLKKYNKKVKVMISDYRINKNVKVYIDEITNIFNSNNVSYEVANAKGLVWAKKYKINTEIKEESLENAKNCYMRRCIHYSDGKIYPCGVGAYIDRNIDEIDVKEKDICNVFDKNMSNKKLCDFFLNDDLEICRHCDITYYPAEVAQQIEA